MLTDLFSLKKTPWRYRFLPVLDDIGFVSLLIIVEGSRSRTGKAMVPKSGLLSVVVNAVTEGVVQDVNIVPVNISYEKGD